MRPLSPLLGVFVGLTAPWPCLPGQSTVASGDPSTDVVLSPSHTRGVAVTPDGSLYALVRRTTAGSRTLELVRDAQGNGNWVPVADTPTPDDGAGSLVVGIDCDVLHVAWSARTNGLTDAYYQEFDTRRGRWIGTPQQLTNATGPDDQYYAQDVEVTPTGTVVVAITTHRRPPASVWFGNWAAGLYVRPAGAASFGPVVQVNTDRYGQRIDLQATGEIVHAAFRTNTGAYGIRYRAFDTASGSFLQAQDVQVEAGTANNSCIAAAPNGDLYVLYNTGGSTAGTGAIRVAYASAASGWATWTAQTVAADPPLTIGNVSNESYSLAVEGDLVVPVYSKRSGSNRDLFARVLQGGQFVTPEIPLATSVEDDRFFRIVAMRNTQARVSGAVILTENRNTNVVGRRIEAWPFGGVPTRAAVRFGTGCSSVAVTLGTNGAPGPGATFDLVVDGPASRTGAMVVGVSCLADPLAVSRRTAPGCLLFQAPVLTFPVATDSGGRSTTSLPVPTGFRSGPLLFQAFLAEPAANRAGVALSNAVAAIPR